MVWAVLIIVVGGLIAGTIYVIAEGGAHLRGAEQLVERMVDERAWRDGE